MQQRLWLQNDAGHRSQPKSSRGRTRASRRRPAWLRSLGFGTTAVRASGGRDASACGHWIESDSRKIVRQSYPFLQRRLRHRDPARAWAGFWFADHFSSPAPAEVPFLEIVEPRECGEQDSERREQRRPGLLAHHFACNEKAIARQLCERAGFTGNFAHAAAQSGKEFFFVSRGRNFRVSRPRGRQCMRVASTDCNFLPLPCQGLCIRVGPFEHVAIASLNRRKVFPEPGKVFAFARASEIGEDVVDAEEKAALGKVHE